MRRLYLFAAVGLLCLASCSNKGEDLYNEEAKDLDAISANMQKIFGVKFNPNHDWCTTVSGEVTVNVTPDVKKVQLLVYANAVNEYDETYTTLKVLNEAEITNQSTINLTYDAPKDHLALYVAFISDGNYQLRQVEGSTVSNDESAGARAMTTRAETIITKIPYPLPTGEFQIDSIADSYASARGWAPGEKLYMLSDYATQKMAVPEQSSYSDKFINSFRALLFSYFPNGRGVNNLPKVKESGYYNDMVYIVTTGEEPVVLSPVYKRDGAPQFGKEVYNSDLYYYYYKDADAAGKDFVEFVQSLPKYKAIPFNECFEENEDDVIRKNASFALMYFGDGQPSIGTKGEYIFPKGYKIGFMIQAKTEYENGKKQGEVYADGRLNNNINEYGNFKSSNLGENGPRAAWMTLDNRMLLTWESGTDTDFNDVIVEVEGGIEQIIIIPRPEVQVYTYCFEDRDLGDYDMNDVVIKATRLNKTTVEYSLVATGAFDNLYVCNINCGMITDNAEVHSLFGKDIEFINTVKGKEYCEPVTVLKTVPETFTFLDPKVQPYIYNKSTNRIVRLAMQGEDPHAIMIPNDFKYPLETVCVKNAYSEFNNWGINYITSTDWYTKPTLTNVY